jgi:predicted phage-related endonuclease
MSIETLDFYMWDKVDVAKVTLTFKEDNDKNFLAVSTNGVDIINKEIDPDNNVQKQIIHNILDMVNEVTEEYYKAQKSNDYEEFKNSSNEIMQKINSI